MWSTGIRGFFWLESLSRWVAGIACFGRIILLKKAKEDVTMKLKWKRVFLTFAVLTVALAGCSSSDSTTPQQAESAKDTFRKYSGYHHDVEFRQALRNSWVGASETSENRAMAQNDQPDTIPPAQGPVSDALLDVGKKIGGGLIKKGLSYAIDKAFGIQSKAQKEQEEVNFINHTLLGIQHQLTSIQNTLTDVYNNQVEQMQNAGIDQLQVITDFSNAETLIVEASSSQTHFENLYSTFIPAIEKTTSAPDWEVDFDQLCGSSKSPTAFISTYYNNLSTDGTDDENTILAYAYDAVNELFGTDALAPAYFATQEGNAAQYINDLIGTDTGDKPIAPAIGINLLSNFYAAGTRVTQAAYGIADILQKSYTVMAFTLQLAVNSNCTYNKMTVLDYLSKGDVYPVDKIYKNIDFSKLTSKTLPDALKTLKTNFETLFVTNAQTDIEGLIKPFLTYDGTTQEYWDPVAVVSHAGLNLASDFMENGCFPIVYTKSANGNGNLDYLAAECNYNNDWTVLQLFVPTNNGTPGMTDINFLNGYGLIGDIDYTQIKPHLQQPNMASDGTCDSHYKHVCTTGFDDCYINAASIALDGGSVPFYGAGWADAYGDLFDDADNTGINHRYNYAINNCPDGGYPWKDENYQCVMSQYAFAITPNGHVIMGALNNTWCVNKNVQRMRNNQINFGIASITEGNTADGSTVSISVDNTQINARGPAQNPVGEDDNENNVAEYGFGMAPQSTPQLDTGSYSICGNTNDTNTLINLNSFYSYSDGDEPYLGGGTITDAHTINVKSYTGTFDADYSTLTINGQTWTRATAKTTVDVGQNCMQGLWQLGTGSSAVYMTTNCSYPKISGTVSTDNGDLYPNVPITLSSSSGGDTQTTTTDSLGNYVFMAENGTYTVTPNSPSSLDCTFSPSSKSVTVSTANVSDVDFTATCN